MSSIAARAESFLESAGFDRGPWLVVGFVAGIAAWFVLDGPVWWVLAACAALLAAFAALAAWRAAPERNNLMTVIVALGLVFAAGLVIVWAAVGQRRG